MSENGDTLPQPGRMGKDWAALPLRARWALARWMVPRRRVRCRGLAFTLPCDNWATYYRWLTCSSKEPETLTWIDRWVGEEDLLFDVGANIGLFSMYAALRHPRLRVVAFEPEYSNLHLLRDNIIENRLQERVSVYSVALSNRSAFGPLHVRDLTPGSAWHTEETPEPWPTVCEEGVAITTLDAFCEQTGLRPHCIKVDVDGTEPKVLEGGMKTLSSPPFRSLIVEVRDNRMRDVCAERLRKAGLRCEWSDPAGKDENEIWVR